MASNLRQLRERRDSVATTQKTTRAMELIASSRVPKAQRKVRSATPYANELSRAVSAVATHSHEHHPLTTPVENPVRSGVLVISSDRGLAGAYSANVIKAAEGLTATLSSGQDVATYLCGRKAISYYQYRDRGSSQTWSGFSESPSYENARAIADRLIKDFLTPTEDGGLDEIHVVYTHFRSMLVQTPRVIRLLPLEVIDAPEQGEQAEEIFHEYRFEPDAESVLDNLLPLYVANQIHFVLLQSAASELASRQRAMKSATDNAEQLIGTLSRQANQARQAAITQEITEIVGGSAALSESTSQE